MEKKTTFRASKKSINDIAIQTNSKKGHKWQMIQHLRSSFYDLEVSGGLCVDHCVAHRVWSCLFVNLLEYPRSEYVLPFCRRNIKRAKTASLWKDRKDAEDIRCSVSFHSLFNNPWLWNQVHQMSHSFLSPENRRVFLHLKLKFRWKG